MPSISWTAAEIDILRRLAAQGMSSTQIGARLGKTRNSIISKSQREGIPLLWGLNRPKKPTGPRKPKMSVMTGLPTNPDRKPPQPLPRASATDADKAFGKPVTIMELTADTCRWPIGDPHEPDFVYCGAQPVEGCSYCARHQALAESPRSKMAEQVAA